MKGIAVHIRIAHGLPVAILVFGLAGYCTTVFGQDVQVTARIDNPSILIGDQTRIHLEVVQPGGLTIAFGEFTDTITRTIELLDQTPVDTTRLDDGRLLLKKEYLVTCFDSGMHAIPPFTASYEKEDITVVVSSLPLLLEALRVDITPPDSTGAIFDIKLPYRAPLGFRETAPFVLGGILLITLAAWLVHFFRKRRRGEPIVLQTKSIEPAHVIALRELDKLKSEKLWQAGEVKRYHTRVTEIIRGYFENRYGIPAMELTSSEILESLTNTGFNDNRLFSMASGILYLADLVKFAKARPLPNENEGSMLSAYIFVNETKEAWKIPESPADILQEQNGDTDTAIAENSELPESEIAGKQQNPTNG